MYCKLKRGPVTLKVWPWNYNFKLKTCHHRLLMRSNNMGQSKRRNPMSTLTDEGQMCSSQLATIGNQSFSCKSALKFKKINLSTFFNHMLHHCPSQWQGQEARGGEGGWGAEWGWHVAGARQLLSDGKTAQWLGPHVSWNCPGQPRNQIINSDTTRSVSWLGLAWKFLYGSISNLSLSLQSPKTSLICVYVYVKELRHSCYAVSRLLNTHSHPSIPTALFYLLDGSIS